MVHTGAQYSIPSPEAPQRKMQQTRFAPDDSRINERELEHAPAGDGEMEHAFTKIEHEQVVSVILHDQNQRCRPTGSSTSPEDA